VPYSIEHPLVMVSFLVLTAVTFSLFGFLLGIWATASRSCRSSLP
jgi:ABC-2 type transport system permease protein